jgi:hypothetical protein
VINHTRSEQTISLPWRVHDHIDHQEKKENIKLSPYGIMLLTKTAGV